MHGVAKISTKKPAASKGAIIHNTEIVDALYRLAELLEIEGANSFRVRAYRNAARTIGELPESVASMSKAATPERCRLRHRTVRSRRPKNIYNYFDARYEKIFGKKSKEAFRQP